MSLKRLLEEFSQSERATARSDATSGPPLTPSDVESIRSTAFEAGYASGWEDARKSDEAAQKHIEAEFERCLQDLGFTYHEATAQLRAEMAALTEALLDAFFPPLMPDLLRATLRDEIMKHVDSLANPEVELVASTDTSGHFRDLLGAGKDIPIRIREEPSLGPNQAFLKFEDQELVVDFQPLVETARAQIAAIVETKDAKVASG